MLLMAATVFIFGNGLASKNRQKPKLHEAFGEPTRKEQDGHDFVVVVDVLFCFSLNEMRFLRGNYSGAETFRMVPSWTVLPK